MLLFQFFFFYLCTCFYFFPFVRLFVCLFFVFLLLLFVFFCSSYFSYFSSFVRLLLIFFFVLAFIYFFLSFCISKFKAFLCCSPISFLSLFINPFFQLQRHKMDGVDFFNLFYIKNNNNSNINKI